MLSCLRIVGRGAKRLEFLDDGPSLVRLGLFSQSFKFSQTAILRGKKTRVRKFTGENLLGGGLSANVYHPRQEVLLATRQPPTNL